jgi:hypothetical protein
MEPGWGRHDINTENPYKSVHLEDREVEGDSRSNTDVRKIGCGDRTSMTLAQNHIRQRVSVFNCGELPVPATSVEQWDLFRIKASVFVT